MQKEHENRWEHEAAARHGGDIYGRSQVRLDFSVNTNPLGIPERVLKTIGEHPEDWERYPDPHCRMLREALSGFYGRFLSGEDRLGPEHFICGNGASDLLYSLIFALRPQKALLFAPCFGEYEAALQAGGCRTVKYELKRRQGFTVPLTGLLREEGIWDGVDWLLMGNPNNPTGRALTAEQLEQLADFCEKKGIFLVVDECFQWFLPQPEACSCLGLLRRYGNVFLLNAFTKIFSVAGLRLGYGICRDVSVPERIRAVRQPWSVSGPAIRAGTAALLEEDYLKKSRAMVKREREFLEGELLKLGYEVTPSQVNYILFRNPFGGDLAEACLKEGILIRSCSNFAGLNRSYLRIAVKRRVENEVLLSCLARDSKKRKDT